MTSGQYIEGWEGMEMSPERILIAEGRIDSYVEGEGT